MTQPWIPRRLQIALATTLITTLASNVALDVYQLVREPVRELAGLREFIPAEQGKITLAVIPEMRRSERERFLFFFGRTYYLTTYRIELENQNALGPVDGRLVVSCRRGRVTNFEGHALLDPLPAAGGPAGPVFRARRYRDALETFAMDLRLPPPGARLSAHVTVVSKGSFVDPREVVVQLGHPGGVLSVEPNATVWTGVE